MDENIKVIKEDDLKDITYTENENIKENPEDIKNEALNFSDKNVEQILLFAGRKFAGLQNCPYVEEFAQNYKNEVFGLLEIVGFTEEMKQINLNFLPPWLKIVLGVGIMAYSGFTMKYTPISTEIVAVKK